MVTQTCSGTIFGDTDMFEGFFMVVQTLWSRSVLSMGTWCSFVALTTNLLVAVEWVMVTNCRPLPDNSVVLLMVFKLLSLIHI